MYRLFFGMMLIMPLSTHAFEIGIDLGGSLKHFDDAYGEMDTGPDRLAIHGRFAESWIFGIEGLYRHGSYYVPPNSSYIDPRLVAPGTSTSTAGYERNTRVASLGLDARYVYAIATHHRIGLGLSGGLNHYPDADPNTFSSIEEKGEYYAASAYYDYFPGEHFSIGLSWREQWDRVDYTPLPGNTACNVNCTGLGNIVYNPYAGLDVQEGSGTLRSSTLALNLGYEF